MDIQCVTICHLLCLSLMEHVPAATESFSDSGKHHAAPLSRFSAWLGAIHTHDLFITYTWTFVQKGNRKFPRRVLGGTTPCISETRRYQAVQDTNSNARDADLWHWRPVWVWCGRDRALSRQPYTCHLHVPTTPSCPTSCVVQATILCTPPSTDTHTEPSIDNHGKCAG